MFCLLLSWRVFQTPRWGPLICFILSSHSVPFLQFFCLFIHLTALLNQIRILDFCATFLTIFFISPPLSNHLGSLPFSCRLNYRVMSGKCVRKRTPGNFCRSRKRAPKLSESVMGSRGFLDLWHVGRSWMSLFAKLYFPNWEFVPVQDWTGNKCETLDSEQTGSNYSSWCRWLQQSIFPLTCLTQFGQQTRKTAKKNIPDSCYCRLVKTTLAGSFL